MRVYGLSIELIDELDYEARMNPMGGDASRPVLHIGKEDRDREDPSGALTIIFQDEDALRKLRDVLIEYLNGNKYAGGTL